MNTWTVETRNPLLSQAAESALATGLMQARKFTRMGNRVGAEYALRVALTLAELLDEQPDQ
jgi:hypothetical protein